MKLNLNLILLIVFLGLSVWLSILVKNLRHEVNNANTYQASIIRENRILKYQLGIFNEVLELNLSKQQPVNIFALPDLFINSPEIKLLMYLKANSCSDCNISTVSNIVEKLSSNDNFALISHTSNKYFIEDLLKKEILKDKELIHYVEDKFIQEHNPVYDAEILIIDRNYSILGRLPLELLKEFELFESLFEKILTIKK
jgi:hypothetical protein